MICCPRWLGVAVAGIWLVAAGAGCSSKWNPADYNRGAKPGTGFVVHPLPGTDRSYGMYVPTDYDPSRSYPTILFLHGLFENGSDPTEAMLVGIGPVAAERKMIPGYIVIFPQARSDWRSDEELRMAKQVLDEARKHYNIDSSRITLTGVSMGGYGVWALAGMYPHEFCALAPMAGYDKLSVVPAIRGIPTWMWHGSGDIFVSVGDSRAMYNALKSAGGQDVRLTVLDSMAHNVWVQAYRDPQFWQWVAAQSKARGPVSLGR